MIPEVLVDVRGAAARCAMLSVLCLGFFLLVLRVLDAAYNAWRRRVAVASGIEKLPGYEGLGSASAGQKQREAMTRDIERAMIDISMSLNARTFALYCPKKLEGVIGQECIAATLDPAIVKTLFRDKQHTKLRSGRYKQGLVLPGLAGLLFMDGPQWERHNKVLHAGFQPRHFSKFARTFHAIAQSHTSCWEDGMVLNVYESMKLMALSNACAVGYGADVFSESGRELHAAMTAYNARERLQTSGGFLSLLEAVWGGILLYRDAQRIRRAIRGVIDEQRAAKGDAVDAQEDWVSLMRIAGFSEKELFNEANHLNDAHKALALVINSALYELVRSPKWLNRLRAEFDFVLDGRSFPERGDLSSLKTTTMIIKEVLRLHPVTNLVVRRTGKPVLDEDGKELLPSGANVAVCVRAMHAHPEFWGKMPEAFDPSRWSDDASLLRTTSDIGVKEAFVPFLDGQRQCAGRFLGELELVVALHALISRFDFSLCEEGDDLHRLECDAYPILKRKMLFRINRRAE